MSYDDNRDSVSFPPCNVEDLTNSSANFAESDDEETLSIAGAGRKRASVPLPPETIPGYRIIGLLGQGGMGVVWEAEQERPRRRVALKVMRREHQVDEFTLPLVSAHLGVALAAQGQRSEAETLLLESIPQLSTGYHETELIIAALIKLYDDWNQAEPGRGYVSHASEWRKRLEHGE